MDELRGRYNWHEGVDPASAAFLARASSVSYLPDGETAIAYLGLYGEDGNPIGDVGVSVSDLPEGIDTVYRVQVADGRVVALEHGPAVVADWRDARTDAD